MNERFMRLLIHWAGDVRIAQVTGVPPSRLPWRGGTESEPGDRLWALGFVLCQQNEAVALGKRGRHLDEVYELMLVMEVW